MISELFPHLGAMADELCVIRSLHTDIVEHFQAVLAMHTGSATVPMPSLGAGSATAWARSTRTCPSYVVLCEHLPYAGTQVWDSSFLPPIHQGVRIVPGPEPIPDLRPPARPATLGELERHHAPRRQRGRMPRARPGDADLRARIVDLRRRPGHDARGARGARRRPASRRRRSPPTGSPTASASSFGWQCLIARRLVERGVRVVELIDTGSNNNWDAHGDMQDHRPKALRVDRAIAALIGDLKQRGLLEPRRWWRSAPSSAAPPGPTRPGTKGRNHYAKAFSALLAGAGVKGGMAYGETDEFGIDIVANPVHVHDYHATILHLMGIDHTRLIYRYAGRDFRLTDVTARSSRAC